MADKNKEKSDRIFAIMVFVKQKQDEGYTPDQITDDLVKKGFSQKEAKDLVSGALVAIQLASKAKPEDNERAVRSHKAKEGTSRMLQGCALLLLGIGITAYTYFQARSGQSYTICWGAIGIGALLFLVGFNDWVNNIR
jgi:hypothetical protein